MQLYRCGYKYTQHARTYVRIESESERHRERENDTEIENKFSTFIATRIRIAVQLMFYVNIYMYRKSEMCVTAVTLAFFASIFHVFAQQSLVHQLTGCYALYFFFFLLWQLHKLHFLFLPQKFIRFSLCVYANERTTDSWFAASISLFHSIFTRCTDETSNNPRDITLLMIFQRSECAMHGYFPIEAAILSFIGPFFVKDSDSFEIRVLIQRFGNCACQSYIHQRSYEIYRFRSYDAKIITFTMRKNQLYHACETLACI